MILDFKVFGQPATQGSKKAVPIYRNGQPIVKDGRTLTRVVDDNPKLSMWRQEVAQVAYPAFREATDEEEPELLTGPIELTLTFSRPRPRSHYGTGRNAGKLKPSAPAYPITRPDTIKLARAVEDALTGVVWRDDSQVVDHCLLKKWGTFGVEVCVVTKGPELTDRDRKAIKTKGG